MKKNKKKQRPRMLKVQKQEMFLFFSGVICQSLVPPTEVPGFRLQRSCVTTRSETLASFDTFVVFPVILRVCVFFLLKNGNC